MLRLLIIPVAPRLGLLVDQKAVDSVTRGLIGDSSFAVLPIVSPKTSFVLTVMMQIVSIISSEAILLALTAIDTAREAFSCAQVGDIRGSDDPLRVCILPVWMACSRESHLASDHTILTAGPERSEVFGGLSTSCRCGSRILVSVVVHGGRISSQDGVYCLLAHPVSASL